MTPHGSTQPNERHPTDQQLEASVARTLLIGVLLATAIVVAGGALYLRHAQRSIAAYSHFQEPGPAIRTIDGVWHGALQFHPASLIQLGLLVLIATPIARVLLCLLGFARQRDRLYVVISAVVLSILIFSLVQTRL